MTKKSPNLIDRHVGSRVRMRRVLMGMSQEKLGEALGVTFQQVQKYEKGTNRIGASRLQQIAAILQVPIEFFFHDAPRSGPERPPGFGEAEAATYVSDFLSSNEGVELNQAFARVADARVRRRIVDLVKAIADSETAAESLSAPIVR
jgi:transcriptional regulator with XRE-family HTH domain